MERSCTRTEPPLETRQTDPTRAPVTRAAPAAAPRVGAGRAAALLLVDFARGWTDPSSPLALPCAAEVEAAARLLAAARDRGAPVVFTTVAYDVADLETVPMLRKTPRVRQMRTGSPLVDVDSRLSPRDGELVLVKKHASAFFGTPLLSFLVSRGVDTLLIGGVITSGCVRTSAVDAAQHVVADATADRSAEARSAALQTVDDLYGDVVTVADAENVLARSWA
jgi:maleamate amidohydrolase